MQPQAAEREAIRMVREHLLGPDSGAVRAAATRTRPSTLWTAAPMTTSTNPSGPRSCWRASGMRCAGRAREQGKPAQLVTGELEIDLLHRRVRSRGQDVHLPAKPYAVLRSLAENAGKVLTHEELLRAVWGEQCVDRVTILAARHPTNCDASSKPIPPIPAISSRNTGRLSPGGAKAHRASSTSAASCGVRTENVMSDRSEHDHRPSPDALLQQAAQEGRGRLKIFLGAAPGVGKTFEMLMTAQAKRREGTRRCRRRRRDPWSGGDQGAARRPGDHSAPAWSNTRATWLEEMDLDAILERRPAAGAGRRACPHQRTRQPPSEALHGCRGAARAPASMSTRRSTSSTSKASTTSLPRSPAFACAKPFRIRSSTGPTRSSWST